VRHDRPLSPTWLGPLGPSAALVSIRPGPSSPALPYPRDQITQGAETHLQGRPRPPRSGDPSPRM